MDDHTVTQIAPSGLFGQSFLFQNNNPLLSQSFKDAMGITARRRRPSHPAPQHRGRRAQQDIRHDSYRVVIGAKGDFLDNVGLRHSGSRARSSIQQTYLNDFSGRARGRAERRAGRQRRPGFARHRARRAPVRHLPHRWRDAGGAQLHADAGIPERLDAAEHRGHPHHVGSRQRIWLDAALGEERRRRGVRLRAPHREAQPRDRHLLLGA